MDDLDLSALSLKELNALASKIDVQILTLQRRNLSEALSEIEILVSKRGLKMSTIIAALTGDSDLVKASVSTIKWLCCANLLTAELPLSPDRLILRPL